MTPPVQAVRVRVPATSANLGPGFDCAGLALSCWDVVDVVVTEGGLTVEVAGTGAHDLPTDESHLVVRAFRTACEELGWSPAGLHLSARNGVPQGRGLGSSAAAVTDRAILAAYRLLARTEAVFVEPASAASVAGLLQVAAAGELAPGQRVVCTVTGNGLKDPEWAISGAPAPVTIPVDAAAAAAQLGL